MISGLQCPENSRLKRYSRRGDVGGINTSRIARVELHFADIAIESGTAPDTLRIEILTVED